MMEIIILYGRNLENVKTRQAYRTQIPIKISKKIFGNGFS